MKFQIFTHLNLQIIDSGKNVNSYELAQTADLVLVFGSTIAIESLLLGKRTYVAANSDWIHCPSILSYLNVPDYDVFLNEEAANGVNSDLSESDLILAYRFLYNYLFKCFVNFPFIEQLSQSHNQIHAQISEEIHYFLEL
jgi:fructose-specific component phosphotransferase system IIB-like protein